MVNILISIGSTNINLGFRVKRRDFEMKIQNLKY